MLAMLTRRGSDTVDQHALTGDTVSISDVEFLRSAARRVHVSDAIMQYAVNIAATSRGAGTKPVQDFPRSSGWAPRRARPSRWCA